MHKVFKIFDKNKKLFYDNRKRIEGDRYENRRRLL